MKKRYADITSMGREYLKRELDRLERLIKKNPPEVTALRMMRLHIQSMYDMAQKSRKGGN